MRLQGNIERLINFIGVKSWEVKHFFGIHFWMKRAKTGIMICHICDKSKQELELEEKK